MLVHGQGVPESVALMAPADSRGRISHNARRVGDAAMSEASRDVFMKLITVAYTSVFRTCAISPSGYDLLDRTLARAVLPEQTAALRSFNPERHAL